MKVPFIFNPQLFNTLMVAAEATIDVPAVSPGGGAELAPADSSPASETSPAAEGTVDNVNVGDVEQPADIFEGIPTLEELTEQAAQKVPYSEGLLRLRSELERVQPEYKTLQPYKALTEVGEPDFIKSRMELMNSMFSPVIDPSTNQPQMDDRGIQVRSSRPFFDTMETENPGFTARHFGDLLDYEVLDPVTNAKDTLARYFFRSLNLDPDRYEEYRNIDTLLTKTSGAVAQDELDAVAEPDRDAYKTLPQSIRNGWLDMDSETQKWHLDTAKDRIDVRQKLEAREQAERQAQEQYTKQFESRVQTQIDTDLAQVRIDALTALRDNLAKQNLFSGDTAISEDYVDAIVAPLALLAIPELQPLGQSMLDRMGLKLPTELNETLSAFITAREQYKRAELYGDATGAKESLRQSVGLQAKLMAKFNEIALKRSERFGYHATRIATQNGQALAAAAARPATPGGSSPAPGEGARVDPRSHEAVMRDWELARART